MTIALTEDEEFEAIARHAAWHAKGGAECCKENALRFWQEQVATATRASPETTRVMVEALKKIAAKSDRHVKGVAHAEDMLDAIGDIARAALSLHRSKTHDQ